MNRRWSFVLGGWPRSNPVPTYILPASAGMGLTNSRVVQTPGFLQPNVRRQSCIDAQHQADQIRSQATTAAAAAKVRQDLCRVRSLPAAPGVCGSFPSHPMTPPTAMATIGTSKAPRPKNLSRTSCIHASTNQRGSDNDQRQVFWWS